MREGMVALLSAAALLGQGPGQPIRVGSKNFTESRLLGEVMVLLIETHTELEVVHRSGLSSTGCSAALLGGEIDIYAEYTGTAWATVLKEPERISDPLRAFLHVQSRYRAEHDVEWLMPFGLNNSYALAMREDRAAELQVRTISDLARHGAGLRAGFSFEFVQREDGWPGLQQAYGLELGEVRSMEHGLAYAAVDSGALDLLDAYSTDGKLQRFPLRVLIDDLEFFPPYNAAPLVRGVVLRQHPELRAVLQRLAFAIDDRTMIELNFAVEEDGRAFGDVAREFLQRGGMLATGPGDPTAGDPAADDPTAGNPGDPAAGNTGDTAAGDPAAGNPAARSPLARGRQTLGQFISSRIGITLKLIGQHLYLSLVAVLLATLLAVPLGIAIRSRRAAERIAMGIAGVLQTIPSLALLVFMIALPGLGLSARSAIAALFLYALLPILRNTVTGIRGVDADLISAATGMGLTPRQILYRVQLPLAMPTIMAGLRTATVISIGVATLAAFIGAGGLGQPINEGLYLNDTRLILAGAIPAALLALVADWALGLVERRLTPRGMKDA